MNIYCYYTPSHDVFFDEWFAPTMVDDYNIVATRDDTQHCTSARFRTDGWRETQIKKVDLWIRAAKKESIFIGSDVDIQWFGKTEKPLLKAIGERDIAVQSYNDGQICSGFFICRGTKAAIAMWEAIKRDLINRKSNGEQGLLLQQLKKKAVKWAQLPYHQFWSPNKLYKNVEKLAAPQSILMHHATYTVGTKDKIAQLKYVKSRRPAQT